MRLSAPPHLATPNPLAHMTVAHESTHTCVHTNTHTHTHKQNRYEFAVFIIALYIMAIYLGKYVDKPVSEWIQERLVAAVK
jgi:undecaprenyl pyrophosphate phosphatase UppP